MKENRLPKIYKITGIIAFIYAVLLVLYSFYNTLFYVDGTWFHGFTANGFAVLSGFMWIGILLIFKRFLIIVFNCSKANFLLNAYVLFLSISTLAIIIVVYKSIQVYTSLEDADSFNSLTAFATTSISGAILLFVSNFAIILICILLGLQLRKIDVADEKLFQVLGFIFIGFGIVLLLNSVGVIESNLFQFGVKAVLSVVIGLIFYKIYNMNATELQHLVGFDRFNKVEIPEPETAYNIEPVSTNNTVPLVKTGAKQKIKETSPHHEELPTIDLDLHEDKNLVLSYYENLPKDEMDRLEKIVENRFNRELTQEQRNNLVLL